LLQGVALGLHLLLDLSTILLQIENFGTAVGDPMLQLGLVFNQALNLRFNHVHALVGLSGGLKLLDFLLQGAVDMILQALLNIIKPALHVL
jgi:hypothetical protein